MKKLIVNTGKGVRKKMTLFEKIFLTYFFVSIILVLVAFLLADVWEYSGILAIPFMLVLLFFIGYFITKLFCLIWGYNIVLFPNVFGK